MPGVVAGDDGILVPTAAVVIELLAREPGRDAVNKFVFRVLFYTEDDTCLPAAKESKQ